jgi:ADP-dependent NAD(P)H-hydrate dehydratase / NAD(P)H-hydrate epimerase
MRKILNTSQIKALDAYTIKQEPVASIDLMERACKAFVNWFANEFDTSKRIGIVCGTGNNGGDGLGIARLLHEDGYSITIWIIRDGANESDDFKINFSRIQGKVPVNEIRKDFDSSSFAWCDVVIDAIFGSGLSRPAEGIYATVIESINTAQLTRVAVDIPSGLMVDKPSTGSIVKAHHTISFQTAKLSFLLPEYYPYVGNFKLVNIGLDKNYIRQLNTDYFLLEKKDIKSVIRHRTKFDHKGTFGHALLIAGSFGKMGAAVLSAKAALRSGVGLLTAHVPTCGYQIIQMAVPEAMVSVDQADFFLTNIPALENYSAIGIGPGIGQNVETIKAFRQLLEKSNRPMVIDADAINILGANRELIHGLPEGSILTPHPKEFERLVGDWKNDFERLGKQREFSMKTKCIVVLKGAHTTIATPDGKVYFNNTGNPGMATAGSGDVLTGVLTGLLAQGYNATETAFIGVWLHGLAGDFAKRDFGEISLTSTDIINHLPTSFKIFS